MDFTTDLSFFQSIKRLRELVPSSVNGHTCVRCTLFVQRQRCHARRVPASRGFGDHDNRPHGLRLDDFPRRFGVHEHDNGQCGQFM